MNIKLIICALFFVGVVMSQTAPPTWIDPDVVLEREYQTYLRQVQRVPPSSVPHERIYVQDPLGLDVYMDKLSTDCTVQNENTTRDAMHQATLLALPELAWQYGLNVSEAQELMASSSEIVSDIVAMFDDDEEEEEGDVLIPQKRKRGQAGKKFGCSLWAAFSLPAYLILRDFMAVSNIGNSPTVLSSDQKFFVQAAMGKLITNEGVRIRFGSPSFKLFGQKRSGICFSRNIYIRKSHIASFTHPDFYAQTRLLIHELQHVKQYKTVGYLASAFGLKYMHSYCMNGFKYNDVSQEVEARDAANTAMNQLQFNFPQFFSFWKARNLVGALGYPVSTNVHQTSSVVRQRYDKGILEIKGKCYRILPLNYYDVQAAASCEIDKGKPAKGFCDKYPDNEACDWEKKQQKNAACEAAKIKWTNLLNNLPAHTC